MTDHIDRIEATSQLSDLFKIKWQELSYNLALAQERATREAFESLGCLSIAARLIERGDHNRFHKLQEALEIEICKDMSESFVTRIFIRGELFREVRIDLPQPPELGPAADPPSHVSAHINKCLFGDIATEQPAPEDHA